MTPCPLLSLLFTLTFEPLIRALESDKSIIGYDVNGTILKTSAYADDLALFISDASYYSKVEVWLKLYCDATGATINKNKSEAIFINTPPPPHLTSFSLLTHSDKFRYLGITLSVNCNLVDAWTPLLGKFTGCLERWKKQNLSLSGKVTVLKNYALPLLTFQASFLPLPPHFSRTINSHCKRFLRSDKHSKVNLQTCLMDKDDGGLGVPDVESIFGSLKAKWISRLLEPSPLPW